MNEWPMIAELKKTFRIQREKKQVKEEEAIEKKKN